MNREESIDLEILREHFEYSWWCRINKDKKSYSIGLFKDIELAEVVMAEARDKYHGKFARQF